MQIYISIMLLKTTQNEDLLCENEKPVNKFVLLLLSLNDFDHILFGANQNANRHEFFFSSIPSVCSTWRMGNTNQDAMSNGISEPYIDYLAHAYSTLHVSPPSKCPRNVSYGITKNVICFFF